MATASSIEWTDATWNPIAGCTPISPGCAHCYAAKMARRLEAMGQAKYAGTAERRGNVDVFTGRINFDEDALSIPLRWRKPRRVFVNSMSDLFHEDVPFEFVDKVFAVMALAHQHTFQVLTKRPERMAEYLNGLPERVHDWDSGEGETEEFLITKLHEDDEADARLRTNCMEWLSYWNARHLGWPLPNVWLGTSVEDQKRADERIPHLLRCPAAVRFLSCEPLLGRIDLHECEAWSTEDTGALPPGSKPRLDIDWVIVGGESGPGARPCDLAWIRSIVAQCKAAGVACFVKQLGARVTGQWQVGGYSPYPADRFTLRDSKGGDWNEWPADLRVREFPDVARVVRH